jgi:hypothetical protein
MLKKSRKFSLLYERLDHFFFNIEMGKCSFQHGKLLKTLIADDFALIHLTHPTNGDSVKNQIFSKSFRQMRTHGVVKSLLGDTSGLLSFSSAKVQEK